MSSFLWTPAAYDAELVRLKARILSNLRTASKLIEDGESLTAIELLREAIEIAEKFNDVRDERNAQTG